MMRYLILVYLGIITMLTVDQNPLLLAPLVIVSLSFAFNSRWVGMLGVLLFATFSLNKLATLALSDLPELLLFTIGIIFPMVIMLELILSSRPYRIERTSPVPILMTGILLGLFWAGLFLVVRIGKIGMFLGSSISTQILMTISFTLLLIGPFLISSRDQYNSTSKKGRFRGTRDNNR